MLRDRRVSAIAVAILCTLFASLHAQRTPRLFIVPQWAFPTQVNAPPTAPWDSVLQLHVAGSTQTFTMAQAQNGFAAPDWFPAAHPVMPRAVALGGAPKWRACGFCHLPNGNGRPENATVAGLPVKYITAQIAAFRARTRVTANPLSTLTSMHQIAADAPDSDISRAAQYFSALKLLRRNRIVEVANAPATHVEGILYVRDDESSEPAALVDPIAGRLLEVPADFVRHEMHDPTVQYITYVPRGSLALGRRLAAAGPAGPTTACAICHGPKLRGVGVVPPIAGRSPSYILRQLINIRTGARHDPGSQPMLPVAKTLTITQMVALAAYVGSLAP